VALFILPSLVYLEVVSSLVACFGGDVLKGELQRELLEVTVKGLLKNISSKNVTMRV